MAIEDQRRRIRELEADVAFLARFIQLRGHTTVSEHEHFIRMGERTKRFSEQEAPSRPTPPRREMAEIITEPAPKPDGLAPDTSLVHISKGASWVEAEELGWLRSLDNYEFGTPFGPAIYESVPYEQAGRTWSAIVLGRFLHPRTGEVVGLAWRYYR